MRNLPFNVLENPKDGIYISRISSYQIIVSQQERLIVNLIDAIHTSCVQSRDIPLCSISACLYVQNIFSILTNRH